jgi:hypothetical protein
MSTAEIDHAHARLLLRDERLDVDETDIGLGEGYSPERPLEVSQWGLTARAAPLANLFRLLARALPNVTGQDATLPVFDSGVWGR